MSIHTLSSDVSTIMRRLAELPGSKQLSVHTRRYPRLGPAERGHGFEEHHWSVSTNEDLGGLTIPDDAEDVVVTWFGVPDAAQIGEQLVEAIVPSPGSAIDWEYRVFTRTRDQDAQEVVVEVFSVDGSRAN